LPHTGVAEDGLESVKDGAAFALDYYLAKYAHSQGCSYVDFGHSRPFLSDGTLKYKLNWHMEVLPDDDSMGVFAVATPGHTPQALNFLKANPHFHLIKGRCHLSDE
jgi:glyoxylase-like metal-dependent hydrolase (beta-lactamase superfamily II)